jgi:Flp pilus assembly protein TadG
MKRLAAHRPAGSTIIEFALVAFIFFLVMWGFFEFGRAFYVRNSTQHLTRCIARAAVVYLPSQHEAAKQECLMSPDGALFTWPFFNTTPSDLRATFQIRYFLTNGTAVDQSHIDASYDNQAEACVTNVKCIDYVQVYFQPGSVETLGLLATWLLRPGAAALSEPSAATTMHAENMGWRP